MRAASIAPMPRLPLITRWWKILGLMT